MFIYRLTIGPYELYFRAYRQGLVREIQYHGALSSVSWYERVDRLSLWRSPFLLLNIRSKSGFLCCSCHLNGGAFLWYVVTELYFLLTAVFAWSVKTAHLNRWISLLYRSILSASYMFGREPLVNSAWSKRNDLSWQSRYQSCVVSLPAWWPIHN